jgi:hypothetical protein
MKRKLILPIFASVLVAAVVLIPFWETPLSQVPQSNRCGEMCRRRDMGSIKSLHHATRSDVRAVLGDPQNTDQDGEVWLWLNDWESYERSGLPRDWLTMSRNSGGHDGLWIGFDSEGRVRTPLWSLSTADPPASNYGLNTKAATP